MKQTVPCSYDKECKSQISLRPLIEGVENPIPLVEISVEGGDKVFLGEQGVIDLYIKARNALNLKPVTDEESEKYDYE